MYLARMAPVVLLGGCSLIYNPSNIKGLADATSGPDAPDAFMSIDARVDTPIPQDANPAMLAIDSVTPGSINEGAGDGNSRPALIVIHGKNMQQDATVQVTGATNVTVVSHQVSADGNWMAVLLKATVDTTSQTDTGTQALTIAVNETGAPSPAMLASQLVLNNLPQFPAGTTIDASTLAPLYSQVMASNVTFTGDSSHPVILKAVSSITMGTVTIKGTDGSGNTAGPAGPGGCDGGAGGSSGGCSGFVGGGAGASGSGGGGGGGNATDGAAGNGTGAGALGPKHGNDQLVNLVVSNDPNKTNQASGGGGGGSSLLAAAGAGGGGGGTIQLDAGGDVTVTKVIATGGNGAKAGSLGTAAGGGGGGAGGIVIIRSGHGMLSVNADASPGGAGAGGGGGGGGGAGGLGRIRIDAPGGTFPTTTPSAHRGPMFATATQQIVTDVNPMITLLGQPMDVIDGYDLDAMSMAHEGEPKAQMFASGTLQLVPAMLDGYNKLCFTLQPGTRSGDLADTCIEIAYLP